MAEVTEQIVREAPEIEAYKLGLLQSAKDLSDKAITLPTQQVAGFTGLQDLAFQAAQQQGGIGGYMPYLTEAGYTMGDAQRQLGGVYGTASPFITGAMQTADPYRQAAEAGLLSAMQGVPTQVGAAQQGIEGALRFGQGATSGALGAMDAASLAARGQSQRVKCGRVRWVWVLLHSRPVSLPDKLAQDYVERWLL
jgi:hypothetical protein